MFLGLPTLGVHTGATSLEGAIRALFANGEQGAWYDPSDFDRYMATGPELVTNGGFDSGAGWLLTGTTPTISDGKLTIVSSGASAAAQQNILTIGRTYEVWVDAVVRSGSAKIQLGSSATAAGTYVISASGRYRAVLTCDGTDGQFFLARNAACDADLDNVSVRELSKLSEATLFQDSAGSLPVTTLGQPVGLMLDKRFGLVRGPNKDTGQSMSVDNGAGGAVYTTDGRSITITTAGSNAGYPRLTFNLGLVTGVTHECRVVLSGTHPRASAAPGINFIRLASAGTTAYLYNVGGGVHIGMINAEAGVLNILIDGTQLGTLTVDSISVRELSGNHAVQPTATARPTLQARVNILSQTSSPVWTATGAGVTHEPTPNSEYVGASRVTTPNGGVQEYVRRTPQIPLVTGGKYIMSFLARHVSGSTRLRAELGNSATAKMDITLTAEWVRYVSPVWEYGGTNNWLDFENLDSGGTFDVAEIQVTEGTTVWPYQRVHTTVDYDDIGAPRYLQFDGVDDFMSTGSIDFTSTDKMTVWAGARKESDAAVGVLAELSPSTVENNGAFYLAAPGGSGIPSVAFAARGTIQKTPSYTSIPAPATAVMTGQADIAGGAARLRVGGVERGLDSTGLGTGVFGNYPLYLGRRAGTTFPFKGNLYGLTVRGAQSALAQIQTVERFLASKAGITL